MQIAGNKCKVCEGNIAFSVEGKFCPRCETVVHLKCDSLDICDGCGQPFAGYEEPEPDPTRSSFVPRALRPVKFETSIMVLAGLLVLVGLLALMIFLAGLGH
jgi:hypothetical protein